MLALIGVVIAARKRRDGPLAMTVLFFLAAFLDVSAEVGKRDFIGEVGWRMNSVLAYALIKL